jgi:hypothetical protein
MAGLTHKISRRVSFCARLVLKPPSPPKMTLMMFDGCWKPCGSVLSPLTSSLSFFFASLLRGRMFKDLRRLIHWKSVCLDFDAWGNAYAGACQTPPAGSLTSCLTGCGRQPRWCLLACAFGWIPSSPTGFCCQSDGHCSACPHCRCCASGNGHVLVLLIGPSLHHVAELYHGLGAVASKVPIEVQYGEAVLEVVVDVLI